MNGRLGLSTPWARRAIPKAARADIEARIPDGYTIGVTASASHVWRVWVLEWGATMDANRTLRTWEPVYHLGSGIDQAIAWIERHDTATYDGVEVPVR